MPISDYNISDFSKDDDSFTESETAPIYEHLRLIYAWAHEIDQTIDDHQQKLATIDDHQQQLSTKASKKKLREIKRELKKSIKSSCTLDNILSKLFDKDISVKVKVLIPSAASGNNVINENEEFEIKFTIRAKNHDWVNIRITTYGNEYSNVEGGIGDRSVSSMGEPIDRKSFDRLSPSSPISFKVGFKATKATPTIDSVIAKYSIKAAIAASSTESGTVTHTIYPS